MSDTKDEADEPSYTQLGEQGNPFTPGPADPAGDSTTDAAGQDLDIDSEDEQDRADRHD